jgi:SPP1 family phage portal protein
MSDENFASNASGVAMQYKLAGLNYKTAAKEALFKKGLLRRIELISNILNITASEHIDIVKDVGIKFTRNTIDNLVETVDMVNRLTNIISKETAIDLLQGILDPELEKERLDEEKAANVPPMLENEEINEDVVNDEEEE